ncbi:MAG: hypothetical protein ACP5NU_00015 [Methanomicrobiales archaeon]|nr:MAG: hypothetical protein BWY45_03183 [Euryarchaeota archaeon ADurb.Bin294]HNJ81665.1 hypothetical protein [Methanoregulaceae archaeon]HNL85759.1 hypothetical protein [Methanoregulaceae archaeon]HNW80170.1 hypothetical protein [Methanoregulaceae archaeon]HOH80308.1 hypothetical protein [Methanoregulaceae archaeon]
MRAYKRLTLVLQTMKNEKSRQERDDEDQLLSIYDRIARKWEKNNN